MAYIDDALNSHIHRVSVPAATTLTTFNGQTYPAADWIPVISGLTVTAPANFNNVTSFVENWTVVGGNWNLGVDVIGATNETYVLTLTFIRVGAENITRFGGI